WRMPIDAEGEPEALVATPAMELQGRPSPDGRYLLFASDEAGLNAGVYVLDLESGRRWSIALESGGWLADWSQVANEIYYTSDQGLLRVVYEFEPEFAPALAELVRP
ncbi:MAG: hypothetical protein GWO21_03965, partial [Gammaproteobacteria bacterium]|nr:hypothetical protein [Gammaproteobacteria bacterium]